MISKILVAEYNILGRLSNIWMNGLQSTESQLEYMITIILYRISLEYDWFARGVSDVQYAKVLDRLIFLMDHCDSMEILEKRSHYEGSLAVIGALIISRTNARYSPHIDTFIDKYIKALYEGFGLTEYKLVTNIPNGDYEMDTLLLAL